MAEQKNAPAPQEEQSLSELLQIRRAKLKELQNAGQDPFQITKYHVTAHSADIKADFEKTLEQCEAISLRRARHLNILVQLYRSVLRIFAPLM